MIPKSRFLFGLVLLSFSLVWACTQEPDCDNERPYDLVSIGLYQAETETLTQIDTSEMPIRWVKVFYEDSAYYVANSQDSGYFNFKVQLNPNSPEILVAIRELVDTTFLHLKYEKQLEWLSEECGPMHRYEELELTESTTLDSVVINDPLVNFQVDENIRIFY